MLQIVPPHAFILSSLHIVIGALAVGHVVVPHSIVSIAVYMQELALTMGFVILPLSNVFGPIVPSLLAKPFAHLTSPLTIIYSTSLENERWPLFFLYLVKVILMSYARGYC